MTGMTGTTPSAQAIISAPKESGRAVNGSAPPLPSWVVDQRDSWGERFSLPEWEDDGDDEGHRSQHGWKGRDLVHDVHAPVRILDYFVTYGKGDGVQGLEHGGIGTTLTGVVHFSHRAESHQGFCHGGSMCSVMDDIIGWCAFFVTGRCLAWSGYTVQVNTSLRRPIPVGKYLLVRALIVKIERRKVSIEATLIDPKEDGNIVHAAGEGLVILNTGVLP